MSALEHARTVLAAIIPDRRDLLDKALRHLNPEHFPDRTMRNLFVLLEHYAGATGAILTRTALTDMLSAKRADAGKVALYQETYDQLVDLPCDESAFRWSMQQLRELAAERATADALTQAMEILTHGVAGDRGEQLTGHADARTHLLQRFAEIDRDLTMQEAPEGDMRAEADDIISDYASRKAARAHGRHVGVEFGIPELDAKINGVQSGELCLIVGFTSEGKSSLAVQLAWHTVAKQGLNVVFLTTETLRTQVRRRLISRHSCLEVFGLDAGLNSRDIKNGSLQPDLEAALQSVVSDFTSNPAYGRCYIVQVPRGATIGYIESKLSRIQRQFTVDLVIMDYLALLRPDRRRGTDREELSGILKEAKQLATTFDDGRGVPFVSPWQVSRAARQEAERTRSYTTSALSETAEASNSPDLLVSLLAPLDNEQRQTIVRLQVMKNRDGEKANGIEVNLDYATSRFGGQPTRAQTMDDLFTDTMLNL